MGHSRRLDTRFVVSLFLQCAFDLVYCPVLDCFRDGIEFIGKIVDSRVQHGNLLVRPFGPSATTATASLSSAF